MQVINPELLIPSSGSLPTNPERPGDGLFDALLREEEARYEETRLRDLERDDDYRPHERRDNERPDERRSDDWRSEDRRPEERRFEEDRPEDRRDDRRVDRDRVERDEPSDSVDRPLVADTQRGDGQRDRADGSQERPTEGSRDLAGNAPAGAPAEPLTQLATMPVTTLSGDPKTLLASSAAGQILQATSASAAAKSTSSGSGQTSAAVTPMAALVTAPVGKTGNEALLNRGAQAATPSDLTEGLQPGRPEKPSVVANAATKAPSADVTKPNLTAQGNLTVDRQTGRTPAAADGRQPLEDVLVTTANAGLSSRPSAALGGGTATAALVMETKPQPSNANGGDRTKAKTATPSAALTDATAKSDPFMNKAQQVAGNDGKDLITKSDKSVSLSAAPLKLSGDVANVAAGGTQLSSAGTISSGFGGSSVQNASFAETLTASRSNTAAAPSEQIAVQVLKAQQAGKDQINIKLHPAELGRIEVKLENGDDGILRAVISAEKSETLDLLQRDARGLEKALQEAGVKTDSGSLSFNLKGQQQPGQERPEGQTADQADAHDMSQDDNTAPPPPPPAVAFHDGALDIRV